VRREYFIQFQLSFLFLQQSWIAAAAVSPLDFVRSLDRSAAGLGPRQAVTFLEGRLDSVQSGLNSTRGVFTEWVELAA
jgi:hypothetical protein